MLLDNSKSNSEREKISVVTGNTIDLQPQKIKKTKNEMMCKSIATNLKYKEMDDFLVNFGLPQKPTIMFK